MRLKFLAFLLLFPLFSSAQSLQADVEKMLVESEQAYNRGHYQESFDISMRAKMLIGRSDAHIQHSLVKALYGLKNWNECMNQIHIFYSFNPTKENFEYQEIVQLERIVKENLALEQQAYEDALNFPSKTLCQKYINTFPFGKHLDEVNAIYQRVENDESQWKETLRVGTTTAYQNYVSNYPNGLHAEEAKQTIQEWDIDAYNRAIQEGTQGALNSYLNDFPQGNYITEINKRLVERKDYDSYQHAVSSNYIGDYETYVSDYPTGKYTAKAHEFIKNSYILSAEEAYRQNQWTEAKSYYKLYVSKYPKGERANDAQQKIKKCERMELQHGMIFLSASYQKDFTLGLSAGKLNVERIGYYAGLKTNAQIFRFLSSPYTINSNGQSTSPSPVLALQNWELSNWGISTGITRKLFYPLWAYAGLGLNFSRYFQQVEEYDNSGNYLQTSWMKYEDYQTFKLYPELGLYFKPGNTLLFSYGIMRINSVNINQFGLGFGIGSKSTIGKNQKDRREKRLSKQRDGGYFVYSYDELNPIGFSLGSLKVKGFGIYTTARISQGIYKKGTTLWQIDDAGNTDSPWDIASTGETMQSNWAISLGSTRKLIYPIWIYAGIGFGKTTRFDKVDEYLSDGTLYESVWMKNTDHESTVFYPEYGAILRIRSFALRYGILKEKEKNIAQIGLGFSF